MKKILSTVLAVAMMLSLAACEGTGNHSTDTFYDNLSTTVEQDKSVSKEETSDVNSDATIQIKASPDKYTWYLKNYVGKNCATIGYTSIGGDRLDKYGNGILELIFVSADGTYLDIDSDDVLKEYTVIGQNLAPNTEMKYVFDTDDEGNEFDFLVAHQSYEEIVLNVKKVGSDDALMDLTAINPSLDKYTWYVADYVGRNLADCGYISMGGDLLDAYGSGTIKHIIVADDGSYVDPTDEELLKCYVVTSQGVAPNTEVTYTFYKNSDGEEYDNIVDTQSVEEIELHVKRISDVKVPDPTDEETDSESDASDSTNGNLGLDPEFKEAMDSYEAFYTEYCEFMKEYTENPFDLKLLAQYSDLMKKAEKMDEAFAEWDTDDMNNKELEYYLAVNNRVMEMLLDVTG